MYQCIMLWIMDIKMESLAHDIRDMLLLLCSRQYTKAMF